MEQNQKPAKSSQQDTEHGDRTNPHPEASRQPEGHRTGIDDLHPPARKNPGQANPSHNIPGQIRQDQPGQQDTGEPGQGKTQSYPGIKGAEARALEEHKPAEKDEQP